MADLLDAVRSGDRRRALEAIRDDAAETIAVADPSNRAALYKQLRDTLAELDGLTGGEEVDAVDELAARRPTSAKVPVRASGGRQRR